LTRYYLVLEGESMDALRNYGGHSTLVEARREGLLWASQGLTKGFSIWDETGELVEQFSHWDCIEYTLPWKENSHE
jgi:hypothetical protein